MTALPAAVEVGQEPAPLSALVQEWHAQLTLKRSGDTRNAVARVTRIITDLGWTHPRDMNAADASRWVRGFAPGRSDSTINNYIAALAGFVRFLHKTGRIGEVFTDSIARAPGEKGHGSRAMTPEELAKLVRVAEREEASGKGGRDSCRSYQYRASGYMGLRWLEMKKLRVGMINLNGVVATIELDYVSKARRRRRETIAIHPEALNAIMQMMRGKGPDDPLFSTMVDHATFNNDLKRAGIPKHDARGRSLSFHGLRKTFATNAARFGVSQRVTQAAMRHTDPKMTANFYQDAEILPVAEELRKIPMLHELGGGKDGDGEKKLNNRVASRAEMSDTGGVEALHESHPSHHADRKPGPARDHELPQQPPCSPGLGLYQRADGVPDALGPCLTFSVSMTPAGIEPAPQP